MRFDQILTENQELDEVRMGKSNLEQFVAGDAGENMRAGFEAELVFKDMAGSTESDEPEMDLSDDRRPRSISQICDFFHDGDFNGRRSVERLREKMEEEYLEWRNEKEYEIFLEHAEEFIDEYIRNNEFDYDHRVEEKLEDMDLDPAVLKIALRIDSYKKLKHPKDDPEQQDLFNDKELAYAAWREARDEVNEELSEMVSDAMENHNEHWDSAFEEFQSNNSDSDELSEESWLESEDITSMVDITNQYDEVRWPYWNYTDEEGGYSEDNARELGRSLDRMLSSEFDLDVNIKVSGGYHTAKRGPDTWIFEPDGSLEPDDGADMPVEIVSPPMPLKQTIEVMRKFFAWAKSEGAYSNQSTGLHVGISDTRAPDADIDYLKLALFLGDKHVLEAFERMGNTYCKSALQKIESDVKTGDQQAVQDTMDLMRNHMIQEARQALKQTAGHGKYTSINIKSGYIEFRSMGGETYIDNIDEVINTVMRYALAYSIASDPNAEREEYGKKLYKLLSKTSRNKDVIQYFVKYYAGELPTAALKSFVKQAQRERGSVKSRPDEKSWWRVGVNGIAMTVSVVASNEEEAKQRALDSVPEWKQQGRHPSEMTARVIKPYDDEGRSHPSAQQYARDSDVETTPQEREFTVHPSGRSWESVTVTASDPNQAFRIAQRLHPDTIGTMNRTDVIVSASR